MPGSRNILRQPEDWFVQLHKKHVQENRKDKLVEKYLNQLHGMRWYQQLSPAIKKEVWNHLHTKLHEEVKRAGTISEYSYARAALRRGVIAAIVTAGVMTPLAFLIGGFTLGIGLLVPLVGAAVAFGLVMGTAFINYAQRIEAGVKGTFDLHTDNHVSLLKDLATKRQTKAFQNELAKIKDKKTFVERLYEQRQNIGLSVNA
ncbi:MAG: hypothetical protein IPP74_06230 [Alphaproteobacteria bacterium]|nr:hypothetical protein [Alphaproteobacteria bacterium]